MGLRIVCLLVCVCVWLCGCLCVYVCVFVCVGCCVVCCVVGWLWLALGRVVCVIGVVWCSCVWVCVFVALAVCLCVCACVRWFVCWPIRLSIGGCVVVPVRCDCHLIPSVRVPGCPCARLVVSMCPLVLCVMFDRSVMCVRVW